MAQTITSANTSINRSKLPAVYGKITITDPFVFDYGCGKYTAHVHKHVAGQNAYYLPFDPYNKPNAINKASLKMLTACVNHKKPVTVICSNVLNVINDDSAVIKIADDIRNIVNATGGIGYVTVYEGNRSGSGRVTGKDQYQRNEPLRNYLRFFPSGKIEHGMIVIRKEC